MSASSPSAAEVSLNSTTRSALDELSHLSPLVLESSLGLLVKILTNVIDNPQEAKYRRINAAKITPKLRAKAGLKLLEALGFRHSTPEVIASKGAEEADFMSLEKQPDAKQIQLMTKVVEQLKHTLVKGEEDMKMATTAPAGSSSSTSSSPFSSLVPSQLPFKPMYPQEGEIVEDDQFLFFWHAPSWPGQWTSVPFVVDGILYLGPEQYMMAAKAKLFGDHEVFAQILTTANPREQKKLGRLVKNFNEEIWNKSAIDIVVTANYAKFTQHPAFGQRLLATKNKTLVEASSLDPIWGIGMDAKHPDARNPSKWKGKNWLGIALMRVRDKLREQQQTSS